MKKKLFNRILLILLILFIASFVIIDYKNSICIYNQNISYNHIILILVLVILTLSETFDNLSIGKFISLKKNIESKKIEIKNIKSENQELRNQFINISSSITSNQNTNSLKFNQTIGVEAIKANKKKKKSKDNPKVKLSDNKNLRDALRSDIVESDIISDYLKQKGIPKQNLQREIYLNNEAVGLDEIYNGNYIYDGYIKDSETFIELKYNGSSAYRFRYKLYLMLSRLKKYSEAKKSKQKLVLILINLPEDYYDEKYNAKSDLLKEFQPAIQRGYLEIEEMNIKNIDKYKK